MDECFRGIKVNGKGLKVGGRERNKKSIRREGNIAKTSLTPVSAEV